MPTVALLADPPHRSETHPLVANGPLTPTEFEALQAALIGDATAAIADSGADLLLNYRPADHLSAEVPDPEGAVRSAAASTVEDVRAEVQVGSTPSARVGNTVTHLLEREGVTTAAVTWPSAAWLQRSNVAKASMTLRSVDVVLGPSTDGRVYFAGFTEPIDFEDVFEAPAIEGVVDRAREADLSVGFLPTQPLLQAPRDLPTAVSTIRSVSAADGPVPERTAALLEDWGLQFAAGTPPGVSRP